MTAPAAAPATPKTTAAKTEYIILAQGDDTYIYNAFAKRQTARSATVAIEQHVEATHATSGIFVAIPVRSWRPVTVTVETKTTIKLG